MNEVAMYTDGACKGNPGPGGWGAVLSQGGVEKEIFGGELGTTNNRMELSAVIEALAALREVELISAAQIAWSNIESSHRMPPACALSFGRSRMTR